MTVFETIEKIHSLKKFRPKPTLECMRRLVQKLEVDLSRPKFIHIAGTNGKGSTATMLASIAEAQGLKVGLFTSPYIICFNERIRINGEMISDNDLVRLADRVFKTGEDINEFECITAIAFMYFAEKQCDLVILECGVGGLYDPTNVISNPLCSVITHIGLDHTEILGSTVEEIALKKIGIAKPGCPVVSAPCQPANALETMRGMRPDIIIVEGRAEKVSSSVHGSTFSFNGEDYGISLVGAFQINNALTAITVAETVGIFSKESIKQGLRCAFIPARAEVMSQKPLIVLDGAHNPDGAEALLGVISMSTKPRTAVVGMMKDKDADNFLRLALPYFDEVVTVSVESNPRSILADELCSMAEPYCQKVSAFRSYEDAVNFLKNLKEGSAFIFGSLYLASDIRRYFK